MSDTGSPDPTVAPRPSHPPAGVGAAADAVLRLEFVGEMIDLRPGAELTLGRAGDLVIDDNPYLHLVAARLAHHRGSWWLENVGPTMALHLADELTASFVVLAPGATAAVSFQRALLHFEAGPTTYEVRLVQRADGVPERLRPAARSLDASPGSESQPAAPRPAQPPIAARAPGVSPSPRRRPREADGELPRFTAEQVLLIVAMCEHRLAAEPGRPPSPIPTNQQIADRLGWTITKLNRKLDHICGRLARRGIPGLRGSERHLAMDRRRRLVEYALSSGLVTAADLALLPDV
jgi:hypothetical protein